MKLSRIKGKRRQLALQLAFSIIVFIAFILLVNTNILISPKSGMHTKDKKIIFEWFGLSNALVDDSPEFTSPVLISKINPVAELKPGTYYWKAGFGRTHQFTIDSEVSISVKPALMNNDTTYKIQNQGNTKILLRVMGLITGNIILEPEAVTYQENVSGIEKIEASQND